MERKIIQTDDGSHSISIPEMNVTYHSVHGAIQESQHVFIEAGLLYQINRLTGKRINILEMGFGTGLNVLLSLIGSEKTHQKIYYETVELFPLNSEEIKKLNYCEPLNRNDLQPVFEQLHTCAWDKEIGIDPSFIFKKVLADLTGFSSGRSFNLVYFDAFAPNAQPGLWTKEIFEKMFFILEPGGILVTYCSKGDVRRSMQSAGFQIEKLPGPPGKREITRAKKI